MYVQFSSVAQSCLTLWDPVACRTLGFRVHPCQKLDRGEVKGLGAVIVRERQARKASEVKLSLCSEEGLKGVGFLNSIHRKKYNENLKLRTGFN